MANKTNLAILDTGTWDRAKQLARDNGKNVSEIVFDALKAFIPENVQFKPFRTTLEIIDEDLWKWHKQRSKELGLTVSENLFRIIKIWIKYTESKEPTFDEVMKSLKDDGFMVVSNPNAEKKQI